MNEFKAAPKFDNDVEVIFLKKFKTMDPTRFGVSSDCSYKNYIELEEKRSKKVEEEIENHKAKLKYQHKSEFSLGINTRRYNVQCLAQDKDGKTTADSKYFYKSLLDDNYFWESIYNKTKNEYKEIEIKDDFLGEKRIKLDGNF